jgi:hypothetical protein
VRSACSTATFWLAGVLAIALFLRIQRIADLTMYFDECCSWKISQFPWDEMIDAISRDAHPPLYYMLMKGMGFLGASSPVAVRGFSVFFGLATIAAAFWLVKTMQTEATVTKPRPPGGHPDVQLSAVVDEVAGEQSDCERATRVRETDREMIPVLAAGLVAASALHVELSQQARPYTLGTFLMLISATFLLRSLRSGRMLDWVGFGTTATLLSLTHYFCLFIVGAEFLFATAVIVTVLRRSGWCSHSKRQLLGFAFCAWGLQAVWSTWLTVFLFQRERSTQQLWMSPLDWEGFSANCWMALAGGSTSSAPPHWAWLAVTGWVGAVFALLCLGSQSCRLAAWCAGIPLAATLIYCLTVRNILGVKYLIFAQTFLLITAALLVARIHWRPVRWIVAGGLLCWSGYWCWQHAALRDYQASYPGISGAVAYLDGKRLADEPVVVGSPFVSIIFQRYTVHPKGIFVRYTRDHRADMLGGPPLREQDYRDVESHIGPTVQRAWTVDAYELFGPASHFEATLPGKWTEVGHETFRELYGLSCSVVVREHKRADPGENGEGN